MGRKSRIKAERRQAIALSYLMGTNLPMEQHGIENEYQAQCYRLYLQSKAADELEKAQKASAQLIRVAPIWSKAE
ncbi:hypothetical protein [Chamaesiphon sp.]|uniref:hypothetical protein n=1 Tax=Chamaesiphon sp. TaxID=2814140 RepID=UPI00359315F1